MLNEAHSLLGSFLLGLTVTIGLAGCGADDGSTDGTDGASERPRVDAGDHIDFCPDPENPRVHYRESDSRKCENITLDCTTEQNGFHNTCGCGCIDKGDPICPKLDESSITWLDKDPVNCPELPPECPLGQIGFSNSCGCGCIAR